MLFTLRRIVQEATQAEGLANVLDLIVQRVREALSVDVASLYLLCPQNEQLTLMASHGLAQGAHLQQYEGLVALVAERAEPVILDNVTGHSRYQRFPGSVEEPLNSFLGVPLLHQRRLLGVLVVQALGEHRFQEDHVAFLVTLVAQLASVISSAEISGELGSGEVQDVGRNILVSGIPGSPGIGIGTAVVYFPDTELEAVPDRNPDSIEDEITLFREAVAQVEVDLLRIKEELSSKLPAEDRALFDAYLMMLSSSSLIDGAVERIKEGNWAPGALRATFLEYQRHFDEMEDDYLRERATDVQDLGRRILEHLLTDGHKRPQYQENTILVGRDISASQLAEVPAEKLAGMVCGSGSGSSHVAILARALGVPAVMGASDLPVARIDGLDVIVDGYQGSIYLRPEKAVRTEFERLAREESELTQGLWSEAKRPAITPDGHTVPVYINSGLKSDLMQAQRSMADGIGLYRTELPFMVRERFPGEVEQANIYERVLRSFPAHPVTLRTLDVGGDKALSYFPIVEDNPFLGYRGIRISLDHPDIFLTQLRAMLQASRATGNLHVLFPMISSMDELDESLALLERARHELGEEGIETPLPRTGVMIEVPSAVYLAEHLARKVDFLSIGTNDLVQYLLAVDRNNTRVAKLYHDDHPAVLCAIEAIVDGAHRAGRPVSVCGEMASDPASMLLLLGAGVDSLSVSVASLPRIKWVIRSFSRQHASEIFTEARRLLDPESIRSLLNNTLIDAGLGALVRAGRH